jgi:hypothetical protein
MTPVQVKTALLQGRFQPHAAVSMIGFLGRHGFLTDIDGVAEIQWRTKREQGIAKPVGIEWL